MALGSDVAGGDRLSMFDAVAGAVRSSKARRMVDGADFLTVPEAWYLGDLRRRRLLWRGPGLRSRKRPPRYCSFRRSAAAAPPSESFRTAGTVRVPASARGHPGRVERRQEDLRGIGLPPPERRLSGAPCNQGPSYSGERGGEPIGSPLFHPWTTAVLRIMKIPLGSAGRPPSLEARHSRSSKAPNRIRILHPFGRKVRHSFHAVRQNFQQHPVAVLLDAHAHHLQKLPLRRRVLPRQSGGLLPEDVGIERLDRLLAPGEWLRRW